MTTDTTVPVKAKRSKWTYALGALFGCGVLFIAMMVLSNGDGGSTAPSKPSTAAKGGLTMAAFNKVTPGSDCAKLADIFGGPGELTAESNTDGTHIQSFDWKSTDMFNIAVVTVMCVNGKVDTKAQNGLK